MADYPALMRAEALVQPELELAGRYVLKCRLGSGGMGEVWRGVDRQLDRPVAIKILQERLADPDVAQRFQREARIAARLQHPGITVVHDVGSQDGRPFIVMELLHGRDLASMLADAPAGVPVDTALSLTIQAAEALQAAHAGQIIHRDLKPANLFLLAGGQLKICDFGIARAADGTTHLTATGQTLGTPSYMSPEQCEAKQVDERSDLYSLGCVLYALLTGRPPFQLGQPLAIMFQHLSSVPTSPRAIRQDIPPELDGFVLALLAKNPADRPPDARHVAATLSAFRLLPAVAADQATSQLEGGMPQHPSTELAGTAARSGQPGSRDSAARPPVAAVVRQGLAKLLLSDAEQAAHSIADETSRASALAHVARACASIDPGAARNLIAGAERAAEALPEGSADRAYALADVVRACADIDPARAERIAAHIRGRPQRTALAYVAVAYAGVDPARAEQIAADISTKHSENNPLDGVARGCAAIDPARAERLARQSRNKATQANVLASVAESCAGTDAARARQLISDAEQVVRYIPAQYDQVMTLCHLASACARIDTARAKQLIDDAQQIARALEATATSGCEALADVAAACADIDPGAAEQMISEAANYAYSHVIDETLRPTLLAYVAKVCATVDPARTRQLIDDAEQAARRLPDAADLAKALSNIIQACAAIDTAPAKQLIRDGRRAARSIADESRQVTALTDLARACANIDPA